MTGIKFGRTSLVAVAAIALAAAPAAAQVCAGYPNASGQTSLGLRASFPTGGTTFGVEASRKWHNPMGAFVNLNLMMPEAEGEDNIAIFGGGLSYDVGSFVPAIPAWLSVCPIAAATFSSHDGVTTLNIPLGVGFGMTLATTPTFSIHPFLIPQFVLTRVSADNISLSDNNFGFGGGALIKFRGVYGGITLGKILVDGSDTDITFSGGLTFPASM